MAIFLGKNYLGQTDKIETTDTEALKKLDDLMEKIGGVI